MGRLGDQPSSPCPIQSEFGPYLHEVAEEFKTVDHRSPSLQHGLAVTAQKMCALNDVVRQNMSFGWAD